MQEIQKSYNFKSIRMMTGILMACLALTVVAPQTVSATLSTRIVVLPFYSEEGRDVSDSDSAMHYRRMMGFIQNRLVDAGFEVIDPFAKDLAVKEYNRVMESARQDSALACRELCRKYAVDAAYIVTLKVRRELTPDHLYRASAQVDGTGYDSAGRSLGIAMFETFNETRRDADAAVGEVEKEVGDLIGNKLTAWKQNCDSGNVVTDTGAVSENGGALEERIRTQETKINIRLDGATELELVEVFGKVLNTVRGVTQAKLYASSTVPNTPQACRTEWAVEIADTEPFRLQTNIIKMVDDIIAAGGTITMDGVSYRYTENEVALLKGLRTGTVSPGEIQFVIDRDRARER